MKKSFLFILLMLVFASYGFSQKKVYCYVAYDPSLTTPKGPASFILGNPALITSIANQAAMQYLVAGTWGVDKWYGAVNSTNDLVTIDTVSGARTLIGTMGINVTGLSYDDKTSNLYAVTWDGTHSSLYTINVNTAAATFIGQCDTSYLISLACDSAGNLYSVSVSGDKLYSVNKATGALTLRGAIGFNASFQQDMEFDKGTNICYMTAFNGSLNQGQLRTVNTSTGLSTLVGNFAGNAEITGLAIPYSMPTTDVGVKAFLLPENGSCAHSATDTVRVTVKNFGTLTVSTPFDVICKMNGVAIDTIPVSVPLAAGDTINITFPVVDLSAPGNYTFKAYTNLSGDNNINNDTLNYAVSTADATVTVNIHTDYYGYETTWILVNNNSGLVVASGGPYNSVPGGYLITTTVCAVSTDCFTFTIYDSFGDGMMTGGYYEIQWNGISMGVNPGTSFTDSAQVLNICAPAADDLGVKSILSPVSSCVTDIQDVIVVIKNYGSATQSNFPVSYTINGGPAVTDTITTSIASGDTLLHTFSIPADLNTAGSYLITSYTSLLGDGGHSNDTTDITVASGGATVPYSMGFEPAEDFAGWSILDANSDSQTWVIMTYNGNFGPYRANYYSGNPANADDWIFTKCIGLETGMTYKLRFYYRETYAGYYEKMSVHIGDNNTPVAMTTLLIDLDSIINTSYQLQDVLFTVPANGTYYIGWHAYSNFYAMSLSIDDINLTKLQPNDPGVAAVTSPASGCLLGTEDISISVVNYGLNALSNIPVAYQVNGGTPVTGTITSTLLPGDTISYTFTTQADFSTPGSYVVKAYTIFGSDPDLSNDTTTLNIMSGAAPLPYSMGFEPIEDVAAWTIENTNADDKTWVISSYYGNTGPYCAEYLYSTTIPANDWLISKCLNFNTGTTYTVSFYYRVASASWPEKLALYIGNLPVSTSLTTLLEDLDTVTNFNYIHKQINFTVPSSGTYFIGWHCYSDANMFYLYLDDINIAEYTGINEAADQNVIHMYPNPANDNFTVQSSDAINRIKVLNSMGEVIVDHRIGENIAVINSSAFATGVYFVQIETDLGITTKKLQIIR